MEIPSELDGEAEIANQLYLPKPKTAANRLSVANVAAPASTMISQTANATLPVTVNHSYVGLDTGFNGTWTVQGLLPPDTTMGVGPTEIVQWLNVKLTVLDKATGAVALGGSGFVNANQIWSGLGNTNVCAAHRFWFGF